MSTIPTPEAASTKEEEIVISLASRIKGCLYGCAIADSLGTFVECRSPGSFEPVTDMCGGGKYNLEPGVWTDDTSMALMLATSLLECNGVDPADQLQRYVQWYRHGHMSANGECFDIGLES